MHFYNKNDVPITRRSNEEKADRKEGTRSSRVSWWKINIYSIIDSWNSERGDRSKVTRTIYNLEPTFRYYVI